MLAVVEPGLSSDEAALRLVRDGANVLPHPRPVPAWRGFLAELTHFFALLFWVAGALAIVGGMPTLGVAVFAVVFINGAFAFVQERRAEHTAERLRSLLPRTVRVFRDGIERSIDPESLVVGDLVVLAEGDRISADQRVVEAHGLAVDESSLTGESVPVHPGAGATVHAGCFVLEGEGLAVVVATGADTRLGALAALSARRRTAPTPMRRELEHVSRIIAVLSVGVGALFFAVALVLGTEPTDGFLFAVGVTVALVPEGLLPTVTLSLAMGAQQMARRNALVRHLEAAETLGSATFICTDKTGTLTCNEMTVRQVWLPSGEVIVDGDGYGPEADLSFADGADAVALADMALAAARCGSGRVVHDGQQWRPQGDPMEAALHTLALRAGGDPDRDRSERPEVVRFAFDARRRRMSVMFGNRIVVKGAPDAVLPLCGAAPGAAESLRRMTAAGLRVLAVADRSTRSVPTEVEAAEEGLHLLGLIGLEDPPRHGVRDAIEQCRRAGIVVAMVTGDHPGTARAVAVEVVQAGNPTVYIITVTNDGPSSVDGATVHDPVMPGLDKQAVDCMPVAGNQCVEAPTIAQLEDSIGAPMPMLSAGQFYEIAVTTMVDQASGTVTNTARVTLPAGVIDPFPENHSDSAVTPVIPDDGLPVTGADLIGFALVAMLLLVAGVSLDSTSRRRRGVRPVR